MYTQAHQRRFIFHCHLSFFNLVHPQDRFRNEGILKNSLDGAVSLLAFSRHFSKSESVTRD
ncbi:MAG: hypothetical protein AUJ72_05655 [Candidatus Omnitrophica bacterium CG1_02_46_14]|nr:MAG: hypothetical protein AUJ72_05655 [Candidatus Omnitrophica bacterium CG1_02_46_14]